MSPETDSVPCSPRDVSHSFVTAWTWTLKTADPGIQHLQGCLLESAACRIHVPSMPNLHNRHHAFGVVYLVKDPIYALP